MVTLPFHRGVFAAACGALLATLLASSPARVQGRLVVPTDLALQAFRLRAVEANSDALAAKIDDYFVESGFPRAGRSIHDKIREAEAFLAREIPASGIVGTGVAVVYQDQVVLSKGYGLRSSADAGSQVSADSMFQIGSVTKTMIAVAVGLLVEEKKLTWRDPVKTHLPWLELYDKYAEQHLTIGDLLAMNSGFGGEPDLADALGAFPTERDYIEALKDLPPKYSLRETPEYANVNFVILGQLIESVSGSPWHTFLRERIWKPLGMDHTFASADDVPDALRKQALNDGHFACDGEVIGPYDVVTAPEMLLSPSREGGYNAAGSVVSSASDMAAFLRLILNKGRVGNVTLLQSPSTIAEMITGKVLASEEVMMFFSKMGLHFDPDGATVTAGYGIDIIGPVMWGHAYFDKSGDVFGHQTRTGFLPAQKLAVIFMGNTQVPDAHASYFLDHFRSYVAGIFLDVPKPILDLEFKKWRAADQLEPVLPGAPRCGLRFWKNPPREALSVEEASALVGSYAPTVSDKFYPTMTISRIVNGPADEFNIHAGVYSGQLIYLGALDASTKLLLTQGTPVILPLLATRNAHDGTFTLNLGIDYVKTTSTASA